MSERFDMAVVGRAQDVAAVAAGVAVALASRSTPRAALVVTCGRGAREASTPSTVAARRLRDRLRARELEARAAGRIVWCAAGDDDPAADARRAATREAPTVLAVCGAREPWVESLLDDAAIVLVVGDEEDALTVLALAALEARGIPAVAVAPPAGAAAMLARIGLGAPSAWRSGLPVPAGAPT